MKITHNEAECRFEYRSGDALAVCDYQVAGDVWTFTRTFVPDSLRGQGVAAALAEAALTHAQALNVKVVPSCIYIESYMKRSPKFAGLIKGNAGKKVNNGGMIS